MQKGKIYVGTSGWHYKHWKGTFYPEGTKEQDQLEEYVKSFQTVELNNSFYHLPDASTFEHWREKTPPAFLFAVKGSRYITHMKKLQVSEGPIQDFLDHARHLGKKLGPILFQLPPSWKVNTERLAEFLEHLPRQHRYAFEFRNQTWYVEEVYDLLSRHGCAFCIYHLAGHLAPLVVTAGFVYVRLHGPGDKYQGSYEEKELEEWANRCQKWQKEGKDVYVYFDNDQFGYAAMNAQDLLRRLRDE